MMYLDHILIYSPTFENHLASLRKVFPKIRAVGLRHNLKMCHLTMDHVEFLGHVVSRHGLQPDHSNTDIVRNWPTPQSSTGQHGASLHELTCKEVPVDNRM